MKSTKRPTQIYQLRIALREIKPPIWRRVLVKSNITLDTLHDIVQDVMGWYECHLHLFEVGGTEVGQTIPNADLFYDVQESSVRLDTALPKPRSRIYYLNDFGDEWEHEIVLEKVIEPERGTKYPVCIAGRRACPPEDCGGAHRYQLMLQALADPKHPEHETYVEWIGGAHNPEAFNIEKINDALRPGSPTGVAELRRRAAIESGE